MEAEGIIWKWDETKLENTAKFNGFQLVYKYDGTTYTGIIELKDTSGNIKNVWKRSVVYADSAFLLIEDNILFICLFSSSATGCYVLALNTSLWEIIWERQTPGLGSIGHSRYKNKVQMQMIENNLCVFGWESGGKYVDILDPTNGELVINKKF